MTRKLHQTAALAVAVTGTAIFAVGSATPVEAAPEVFMSGLANPRGLTFDGNTLYVAEAGAAGDLAIGIGGAGSMLHYGTTGGVSRRMIGGEQEQYIVGLPSVGGTTGFAVEGPQDVAFSPVGGDLHITIGLAGDPNLRQNEPLRNQALGGWLGSVIRQNDDFSLQRVLDVAGYEGSVNPSGGPLDSNPFSIVFNETSDIFAVSDAGGDFVAFAAGGSVLGHVLIPQGVNEGPFGPPIYHSVPTGMVLGPDGALYVAQLTGFPFPQGGANIYRIDPMADDPEAEVFATGFTNLIDMAVGLDGTLYALEHDSDSLLGEGVVGSLYRVNSDGSRELILGDLVNPTGLTVGPDGAWYISANGYSPTEGMVLRHIPEPGLMGLAGLGLLALRRRRD